MMWDTLHRAILKLNVEIHYSLWNNFSASCIGTDNINVYVISVVNVHAARRTLTGDSLMYVGNHNGILERLLNVDF